MCGIAGYLGAVPLDPRRIDACHRAMQHRGPDASGTFTRALRDGRTLHLLHARLSIIDLDARANQPLHAADHVLVMNGELYNYREIRRDRGWMDGRLRTESDAEVMLHVLASDGWAGLDACEGMWALALFDERAETVLLARDRFGEKPLYLHETKDGLYFASEIKLLFALLGRRLAVDHDHLRRYLVNGYKALYKSGAGFIRGVRELPPRTALVVEGDGDGGGTNRIRSHVYWKPGFERDEGLAYDDVIGQVRDALVRSVDLRLRADVPVAFLLSGGVDSNALVSIARRVLDRDVHAFTIVNTDRRYDERELVDHTVETLGLRHTAIGLDTAGFLDRLRTLVRWHDAPVYTITYYAQWLLMQAIAEHGYRISISGTGSDELFSGYYDHHNAYLYEVRRDADLFAASRAAWERHIRPIVRNPYLADPDLFIKDPGFRDHIFLDADVFSASLVTAWSEPFTETRYCAGLLRNRMLNELFHESVPPILHEDDHNAMSQSIENRSPFLDRQLFELCQRIPTRHLVRGGYAKAILRDAMRGIAPDPVLDERRKVGFNAPIGDFLGRRDPAVRSAVLDGGPIFDIVRRDAIESLLDRETLPNSRSKFLFYFLSARMFLEEMAA